MRIYSYSDIEQATNCLQVARELGANIEGDRCNAAWRNGKNLNVKIDENQWYDHKASIGGGVVQLVAVAKFNGDAQQAQEHLGDRFKLTPKYDTAKAKARRRTRLTHLIDDGYSEAKRYNYTDADGKLRHQVIRLEHVSKKKEFIQCAASGKESLEGIETVLYNLPGLSVSDWAILVEGEKDADTLTALDLPATTNAGGAGKWQESYTATLAGKDIVIMPDNDPVGEGRADKLHAALYGIARSIKVVKISTQPKGDVTDWIKNEGGNKEKLLKAIEDAPVAPKPEPPPLYGVDPVKAAAQGQPYAMTDLGNAERLCAHFGSSIRWDVARKVWRAWDGCRWDVDSALRVNGLAAGSARKIRQEAAAAPPRTPGGNDLGSDLFKHAMRSESRDRIAAAMEVAKARPKIAIAAAELDANPWQLNVLNGTIDLRTGTLHPHSRDDLITKLAPVEFHPGLKCKRWENFLQDATGNDNELIGFLQVIAGYTLTGDTSEEKLFLIHGPEAAGKSTFLDCIRAIMGDYSRVIQADLLTKQKESRGGGAASPELAGLAGARLAAGSEMEQGREIAEALAKNLTGGEPITARHLYAELFDFRPQFKLWLALNHCPRVSADDGAIWRRILRIGFEHTVPPERRDKTLKPYLRDPRGGAPAILAWAVEGCLRWQREGLTIPAAVARSTAAYRSESDPLAAFIEDCLSFNPNAWISWADVWRAYNE
ncbi:MAG: phage/plasmid primase, P4 family, partial [Kiritimatiellia bacterium]